MPVLTKIRQAFLDQFLTEDIALYTMTNTTDDYSMTKQVMAYSRTFKGRIMSMRKTSSDELNSDTLNLVLTATYSELLNYKDRILYKGQYFEILSFNPGTDLFTRKAQLTLVQNMNNVPSE